MRNRWLLALILWIVVAEAPTAAAPPSTPSALDRALAQDYHKALVNQGVRVVSLAIIDSRAQGGERRAEIVYRTKTSGALAALRPEIVRLLGPSTNPRLALDQVFVFPTTDGGAVLGRVIVIVPDYDRWLRDQMSDGEFFGRWTVRGLR